jgi:hypothetical protein
MSLPIAPRVIVIALGQCIVDLARETTTRAVPILRVDPYGYRDRRQHVQYVRVRHDAGGVSRSGRGRRAYGGFLRIVPRY